MANIKANLSDLDAAIQTLEVSTNPKLRRTCNCNATRHPLLNAAPNCLNCGKVICIKEGLGPCTFCGQPLLSTQDTQAMIRTLREERGRERMEANNASHRRAEVSKTPRAFATANTTISSSSSPSSSLSAAEQHRDRLLSFQESSAQRTRIIDEVADFETPSAGLSMWATPQERALQLKRQQKVLREQEWMAKPEYEKRQVVVSIDLKGRKVVKKINEVERPASYDDGDDNKDDGLELPDSSTQSPSIPNGGSKLSNNPFLGKLIRPTYPINQGKAVGTQGGEARAEKGDDDNDHPRLHAWRRVQDDLDDNEQIILDGGIFGRSQDVDDQLLTCG